MYQHQRILVEQRVHQHHQYQSSPAPPDLILIVGNLDNTVSFLAHRTVLAGCSGYFKTLLADFKGSELYISNMSSQTFAFLLKYMYTGKLDLNSCNIYEIFLASNLLHVTDAITLCRQYLSKHHYAKPILKPIPCKRAVAPDALKPIETMKYQPLRISNDQSSIFKPVGATNATAATHKSPPASQQFNEIITINLTEENENEPENLTTTSCKNADSLISRAGNVILDIAYCDGPIRFRKVVNKNYNPLKANVVVKNVDDNGIAVKKADPNPCRRCKNVMKSHHQHHHHRQQQLRKILLATSPVGGGSAENLHLASPALLSSPLSCSNFTDHADGKCKKRQYAQLQCYTCKICGSKFPSYYFVHKHRKMHHGDITTIEVTEQSQ